MNGVPCWTTTSNDYDINAIKNIEERLAKYGQKSPTRCNTHLDSGARLEKMCHWSCPQQVYSITKNVLGFRDEQCSLEASIFCISSRMTLPGQGHVDHVYHIFGN
jgi:hypothetical protein